MIKIELLKNEKLITLIKIYGHSNYAEKGKDIVCSAVTGIIQGMFNAILKLCNDKHMDIVLDPSKDVQAKLKVLNYKDENLQLLLRALYYQLYTIKIQFPEYIKIIKKEAK